MDENSSSADVAQPGSGAPTQPAVDPEAGGTATTHPHKQTVTQQRNEGLLERLWREGHYNFRDDLFGNFMTLPDGWYFCPIGPHGVAPEDIVRAASGDQVYCPVQGHEGTVLIRKGVASQ